MSPATLHVLIVDDSALMRQVLSMLLERQGGFRVSAAADPLIAERKIGEDRPDVILLDLEMPRMDGLSFLRRLMERDPIPVVICSGHTDSGNAMSLAAFSAGAVHVIAKPKSGLRDFLEQAAEQVSLAIKEAARQRPARIVSGSAAEAQLPHGESAESPQPVPASPLRKGLLAIGASTGGPEAIQRVLEDLPPAGPPVLIVQHMPKAFTGAFAARLNSLSTHEIVEARQGEVITPGRVFIAPGNRHLTVARREGAYCVELRSTEPVAGHCPSVDVLFRSVAEAAGAHSVGMLLTGMGRDGVEGLRAIRDHGGFTLAQDEASSVVYGMPREAVTRGVACRQAPLGELASLALSALGYQASAPTSAPVSVPVSTPVSAVHALADGHTTFDPERGDSA